jgi:hypothetical protein
MSKKKKIAAVAKQECAVRTAWKEEVRPRESGRWTVHIEPGESAFIADNVVLYVAMKNYGPSTVLVTNGIMDGEKVVANLFRVLPVRGELTLQTMDNQSATVEMEFMPRTRY